MSYLIAFGLGIAVSPLAFYGLIKALDQRDKRKLERMMRGRRPQPEQYEQDAYRETV